MRLIMRRPIAGRDLIRVPGLLQTQISSAIIWIPETFWTVAIFFSFRPRAMIPRVRMRRGFACWRQIFLRPKAVQVLSEAALWSKYTSSSAVQRHFGGDKSRGASEESERCAFGRLPGTPRDSESVQVGEAPLSEQEQRSQAAANGNRPAVPTRGEGRHKAGGACNRCACRCTA